MMNGETEQFEQRLRRQSLKKIPGEWRAEILSAAREAQITRHASPATPASRLSTINSRLSTLLWPHPKAWASLAAVWVGILVLNFSQRDQSPVAVEKFSPPTPEVMAELRQQKLLFAELMGSPQTPDADRRKNVPPGPRSERVAMLMV
jgi:hypothetical protein